MNRCLIPCVMLLASCGDDAATPTPLPPAARLANPAPIADPALYEICPGWTGGPPALGIELILAAEAEIACRQQMAGQLSALDDIHNGPR